MTQSSLHIPFLPLSDSLTPGDRAEAIRGKGVAVGIGSNNWAASFPSAPESRVYLAHNGQTLYALFTIHTRELRAAATADLQPVADDTCFEIFLKKAGDTHYCNFEFNYRGIANVSRRPGRAGAVKFDAGRLSRIRRFPLTATAEPHDNMPADSDAETALLVEIPLALIGLEPSEPLPTRLEGNIYSCSARASEPYFLSWQPIATPEPDFHRPDFFAPIILENNV